MKKQTMIRVHGTPFYLCGLHNFEVEGELSGKVGFLPAEVVGGILSNALVVTNVNGKQSVGYLLEVDDDDTQSSS